VKELICQRIVNYFGFWFIFFVVYIKFFQNQEHKACVFVYVCMCVRARVLEEENIFSK